jgi:phage-related protein
MFDSVYIDDLLVTRVQKLAGLGSPTPRTDVTLLAGRHGAIDRTLYYQGRVLELDAVIAEADSGASWTAFDALKQKLQLGSTHVLKFQRSGISDQEQLEVVVAGPVDEAISPFFPTAINWGVSLHAPDPRIYGATLRSGSYDPAAAASGGGVGMPLTFPLSFPTTTATHLELTNNGNTASPPVLTIQGPVINPVLDNDTVLESLSLVYSLGSSDTVEVDMAERTLKLNGALRYDLLSTDPVKWWELQPGTNRLRLRGTGMATGKTLLTCQYRDARI